MKQLFTLESSRQLTHDTYEMVFSGDMRDITAPGQFINLELPGKFLRRPISICDWTDTTCTILVRVAGVGTAEMVALPVGTVFDVLSGLGNGFDMSLCNGTPILMGGGIGLAPMYGLAKRMIAAGTTPTVVAGFRTGADVLYQAEFEALGCPFFVATEDGSIGTKGFVTTVAEAECPQGDYAFVCGPTPMLKAVDGMEQLKAGQFSFEARMACGFGACVGCTTPVKGGYKRICKDGPILMKEELVW